jgi:hypothetical protein
VQLAQAQAGGGEAVERLTRRLKLDREVAAVVIHADVAAQVGRTGIGGQPIAEEGHCLRARFKEAARLGLEAEVQVAAGAGGHLLGVAAGGADVREDRLPPGGLAGDELLEGAGHGADAAGDARRHERGDEVDEVVGIAEALRRGPVGRVDLFLHAGAVETAVGKSVDRENVAVVPLKPALKLHQLAGRDQLAGRALAEAETDRVGPARGDAGADREGEFFQRAERLRPRLAAVDVGAVGQVDAVAELHGRLTRRCRRP